MVLFTIWCTNLLSIVGNLHLHPSLVVNVESFLSDFFLLFIKTNSYDPRKELPEGYRDGRNGTSRLDRQTLRGGHREVILEWSPGERQVDW